MRCQISFKLNAELTRNFRRKFSDTAAIYSAIQIERRMDFHENSVIHEKFRFVCSLTQKSKRPSISVRWMWTWNEMRCSFVVSIASHLPHASNFERQKLTTQQWTTSRLVALVFLHFVVPFFYLNLQPSFLLHFTNLHAFSHLIYLLLCLVKCWKLSLMFEKREKMNYELEFTKSDEHTNKWAEMR